jgi:ketopantoate reductase
MKICIYGAGAIGGYLGVVRPRCTDNPAELGPQDFVIVCLKAHSIAGVIEAANIAGAIRRKCPSRGGKNPRFCMIALP